MAMRPTDTMPIAPARGAHEPVHEPGDDPLVIRAEWVTWRTVTTGALEGPIDVPEAAPH